MTRGKGTRHTGGMADEPTAPDAPPSDSPRLLVPTGTREVQALRRAAAQDAFLEAYAQTGTIQAACDAVGIARSTHYDWIDADPDYAARFSGETQERLTETLERAAIVRAVDGAPRGVWYKGTRVGEEKWFSDMLLLALLKSRRPNVYGDRQQLVGPDGGPIQVQTTRQGGLAQLGEDALRALAILNGMEPSALLPQSPIDAEIVPQEPPAPAGAASAPEPGGDTLSRSPSPTAPAGTKRGG